MRKAAAVGDLGHSMGLPLVAGAFLSHSFLYKVCGGKAQYLGHRHWTPHNARDGGEGRLRRMASSCRVIEMRWPEGLRQDEPWAEICGEYHENSEPS